MYKDAMETAVESKDFRIAEDLLYYFVEMKSKEWFTTCLYTCYELIRPDVVLELAWRYNMMDFAMPFMVQFLKESSERIEELEKANAARTKKEELLEKQGLDMNMLTAPIINQPMITAGPSISVPSASGLPSRNYVPTGSTPLNYPSNY
jgi:clathrin heavy chain